MMDCLLFPIWLLYNCTVIGIAIGERVYYSFTHPKYNDALWIERRISHMSPIKFVQVIRVLEENEYDKLRCCPGSFVQLWKDDSIVGAISFCGCCWDIGWMKD